MTKPSLILVPLLVNARKIDTLRANFDAPIEIVLMRNRLEFSDGWLSRISKEVKDRLTMISMTHGKNASEWGLVVTGPAVIDLIIFHKIYELFREFPILLCYDKLKGNYKILSLEQGDLDESSISS